MSNVNGRSITVVSFTEVGPLTFPQWQILSFSMTGKTAIIFQGSHNTQINKIGTLGVMDIQWISDDSHKNYTKN